MTEMQLGFTPASRTYIHSEKVMLGNYMTAVQQIR